jgi:hypothetical protein
MIEVIFDVMREGKRFSARLGKKILWIEIRKKGERHSSILLLDPKPHNSKLLQTKYANFVLAY